MNYEKRVFRTIDDVNSKSWDDIAKLSLLKFDTLKAVEGLKLCKDVYYVEISDEDGLVAIAVFYGQSDSLYASIDESLYGFLSSFARPFVGLNPSLVCYFPYSPFYKMFDIKEGYNKQEVFSLISEELKSLAQKEGYRSYGFMGIDDETYLNNSLKLFPFFAGFKSRIKVRGKDLNEHVDKIEKRSERYRVKKELRNLKNVPFYVEKVKNLNEYEESVLDILNKNFEKYFGSYNSKDDITREYIKAFDKHSNRITYFLGKLKDEIISVGVFIEDDSSIIELRVGQSVDKSSGSFFDLAIYEPTKYAIESSKKYLELGSGNYEYKIRRGATLSSCYNLIKSTSRFRNFYLEHIISFLNKRNRNKHLNRAVGGRIQNDV